MKFFLIVSLLFSFSFGKNKTYENFIEVYLEEQKFFSYKNREKVLEGSVNTGKKGFRTPRGYFTIYHKEKNRISKSYPKRKNGKNGGAKMKYAMFLKNEETGKKTGIAFHVGKLFGKGSHGCIRLSQKNAKKLFQKFKFGDLVVIKWWNFPSLLYFFIKNFKTDPQFSQVCLYKKKKNGNINLD